MTEWQEDVDLMDEDLERVSQVCGSSRSSKLSTTSSMTLRARTKAEEARAKLEFAKKGSRDVKTAPMLHASYHKLKLEKAAANAEA